MPLLARYVAASIQEFPPDDARPADGEAAAVSSTNSRRRAPALAVVRQGRVVAIRQGNLAHATTSPRSVRSTRNLIKARNRIHLGPLDHLEDVAAAVADELPGRHVEGRNRPDPRMDFHEWTDPKTRPAADLTRGVQRLRRLPPTPAAGQSRSSLAAVSPSMAARSASVRPCVPRMWSTDVWVHGYG